MEVSVRSTRQSQDIDGRRDEWNEIDKALARLNGWVPASRVALAMLFTALFCSTIAGILGDGIGARHTMQIGCSFNVDQH